MTSRDEPEYRREMDLLAWYDEPSPAELERMDRNEREYELQVASRPVGSRVTRKAA